MTTEVIGEGDGGGKGLMVRREIVANRTSEGDSILSTKSGVLIATVVAANMIVITVAGLS
jgi:hypothetical protein